MIRRAGFTLIEICIAIAIAVLLLGFGIKSLTQFFAEQKRMESYERFNGLVRQAQLRSVTDQRSVVLVCKKGEIALEPELAVAGEGGDDLTHFSVGENETFQFERTAALVAKPPMEWVFWRSGTCEPVTVSYQGPSGGWVARFDPLTVRGTLISESGR